MASATGASAEIRGTDMSGQYTEGSRDYRPELAGRIGPRRAFASVA